MTHKPEPPDTLQALLEAEQVLIGKSEQSPESSRTSDSLSTRYRRVLRRDHPQDTVVTVRDVTIGATELCVIAGPCAVETPQQLFKAAEIAAESGAHLLRGGAFKLRTSPYAFPGLGEPALKLLAEARRVSGLPVVTEVVDEESAILAALYADVLQVGTRNMFNYVLLKQVARTGKPILLKRGMAATLEEFLHAAEYILAEGNDRLMLCERGIRGFSDYSRNTLDLNIVPALKQISHLPILTDPSHGTGMRNLVLPMARASVAAGADGVLVEMHPDPDSALSDGFQSLHPEQLTQMIADLTRLAPAVGRTLTPRGR
jgi:3-deoxy-7-phosphoheptulonate synthase